MKDINKIPLLTPEHERELAQKVQSGDQKAREEMINANLRLVVNIAKKYINCGLPFQDIIGEGNAGLLKAVERFDPDRNCRFSTYATWWIRQSILRALTDGTRTVRIPSYMRDVLKKAEEIAEEIILEKGVSPTIKEVAARLVREKKRRLRTENILKLSYNLSHIQSIDKICEEKEIIEDPNSSQEQTVSEDTERLEVLLQSLESKKRQILQMRFGLYNQPALTLQEISKKVELSRERVRQIIKESLYSLRATLQKERF